MLEHLVAHTLYGANTQILNRHSRSITEGVAEQVHNDCYHTEQCQEAHGAKLGTKDYGVEVAQYRREARLGELYCGKLVDRLKTETILTLEHCVEYRDNHRIVEGVEQRMEGCKEEVWYGITTEWLSKVEQS